MDFTREPIIETVITPKEGSKIVVRSSKSTSQEEYFVDAVEVVSFGRALFFRSKEKPKPFLLPATDYEILEVREARMVLKNVGFDRSIKIGGGKKMREKPEEAYEMEELTDEIVEEQALIEGKHDKRKERRKQYRRRRGRDEIETREAPQEVEARVPRVPIPPPKLVREEREEATVEATLKAANYIGSLLPPPPTLISETLSRFRESEIYKEARLEEIPGSESIEAQKFEEEVLMEEEFALGLPEEEKERSEEEEERFYQERFERALGENRDQEQEDMPNKESQEQFPEEEEGTYTGENRDTFNENQYS